ncbi:hypothetical protein ACFXPI_00705 [Streptomyces sp. NPDC059104]|uniref:hypothetical protein n=1 Tax=Streptomyces sp. NPDC059104 TaxID=3346729 RepID=UPI0036CD23C7
MRFSPIGVYDLFGVPMRHWDALDLDPVQLLPPSLRGHDQAHLHHVFRKTKPLPE